MAEVGGTTIECGFCCRKNEDLENPKTLPCSHAHCFGCLTAFFEINHMTRCPVPGCGEIADEPINRLPSFKENSHKSCDVCVEKKLRQQKAFTYCRTCEKKYCKQHEEHHDALLTGHKKVDIAEYEVQHRRMHTKECTDHPNQLYTLGCKVCLRLICVNCVSELGRCMNGSAHKLMSLDELVAVLVEDDIKVQMIAKEEKLEKLFKLTSKVSSEYDNDTTEMLKLLRDTRDGQLRAIREKYDTMEEELKRKRQVKRVEMIEFLEEEVLPKWTQLSNQRQRLETKLKHGYQVDIVKEFSEMKVSLQKLVDEELPKLELSEMVKLNKKRENTEAETELVLSDNMVIDSELGFVTNPPITNRRFVEGPSNVEAHFVTNSPSMEIGFFSESSIVFMECPFCCIDNSYEYYQRQPVNCSHCGEEFEL